MSSDRFIITPKHTFDLNTQVIHCVSEQEAARVSQEKYLETGVEWEVFQSRGSPAFDAALIHTIIKDNIELRARLNLKPDS